MRPAMALAASAVRCPHDRPIHVPCRRGGTGAIDVKRARLATVAQRLREQYSLRMLRDDVVDCNVGEVARFVAPVAARSHTSYRAKRSIELSPLLT